MTFLIDADLPWSAADVVRRHGYEAVDVRDIGLRHADNSEITSHAPREQQSLLTGDVDFAAIRNSPPQQYAGSVVLVMPPTATALYITQLPGALAPSMVSRRTARGRRAGGWGDAAAARGEKRGFTFPIRRPRRCPE